jgi:hypothetical protein
MVDGGLILSIPGLEDLNCPELLIKLAPPISVLFLTGSCGA